MSFGSYLSKNWICSLERIDVAFGYLKTNVCLICAESNTSIRLIKELDSQGSSSWTKKKYEEMLN